MKILNIMIFGVLITGVTLGFVTTPALAVDIAVNKLSFTPKLDGNGAEWKSVKATKVRVSGKLAVKSVSVKVGVRGAKVYFLAMWADKTMDDQHKPFVWNSAEGKYKAGPQREDRLALQFAMSDSYSSSWDSGKPFRADMWHWKAGRSNPIGIAHDKMTIITTSPQKKAFKLKAKNGTYVYIRRPSDSGSKIYSSKRYRAKKQDTMPKYILNPKATGSITDVKAKGVWKNGMWTLELMRKLNTSNPDDAVFVVGKSIKGALAVFDHSGDNNHNRSGTIQYKF